MMRPIAPRVFRRNDNRLTVYLHPDQWTDELPLPPSSRIEHVGEHHEIPLYPSITFILEPDHTREVLAGYFVIPMAFNNAIEWFQREMNQLGWETDSEGAFRTENRTLLPFRYPDTHARVTISLQWWSYRNQSTAMIQREVIHPYEKIEIDLDQVLQEADELQAAPSNT